MFGGGAPLRCASVMPSGKVSASKWRCASDDQSSSATMFAFDVGVRAQRRGVAGVEQLRRHEQRHHAVRRGERERALDEGDGEIGLMERRAARAVVAEEREAFGVHPLRARRRCGCCAPTADCRPRRRSRRAAITCAKWTSNEKKPSSPSSMRSSMRRLRADALVQLAAALDVDRRAGGRRDRAAARRALPVRARRDRSLCASSSLARRPSLRADEARQLRRARDAARCGSARSGRACARSA